jgi:hypothetical protein
MSFIGIAVLLLERQGEISADHGIAVLLLERQGEISADHDRNKSISSNDTGRQQLRRLLLLQPVHDRAKESVNDRDAAIHHPAA